MGSHRSARTWLAPAKRALGKQLGSAVKPFIAQT